MTANAGYHAYATGDVLTAAQVQYNLQNQTVMYFATTTARDTALSGKLVDGMCAYTPATGVLVYVSATSTWTALGASLPSQTGNAGKYLTTDGSAASWGAVSTASMTLLSTTTLSGASTTVSSITQSYKNLLVELNDYYSTGGGTFQIWLNGSSGANNVLATVYGFANSSTANTIVTSRLQDPNTVKTSQTNAAAVLTISNYASGTINKTLTWYGCDDPSSYYSWNGAGSSSITSAITSLVFRLDTGTFNAGTVKIYGVN